MAVAVCVPVRAVGPGMKDAVTVALALILSLQVSSSSQKITAFAASELNIQVSAAGVARWFLFRVSVDSVVTL
jgi:hypothetical protein